MSWEHKKRTSLLVSSVLNSESTLEGNIYQQSMNINKSALEEKKNANSLKIKGNLNKMCNEYKHY